MTTDQQTYKSALSANLARYKRESLHVDKSGTWNHRGMLVEYEHILPPELREKNLLSEYREEIWRYVKSDGVKIKLHQYFHHLNSSQAMCLNLFYPFIADDFALMPILQKILCLPKERVQATFEKVFSENFYKGENTNFDFYLESLGSPRAFFEIKLKEGEFGQASKRKNDSAKDYLEKYTGKREKYHRDSLETLVDLKWLEFKAFTENYQLLRNISYLGRYLDARLFVIFPKANKSLRRGETVLREILAPKLNERVSIIYLEDLIDAILESEAMKLPKFAEHLLEFKSKYMV